MASMLFLCNDIINGAICHKALTTHGKKQKIF